MKREVIERLKAEKESRANQNVSLVSRTQRTNPTLALRIAEYNLNAHPDNASAAVAFHDLVSDKNIIFYGKDLEGHVESVNFVDFFPNGRGMLTMSRDNIVKLWDLEANELKSFKTHTEQVATICISPNGKYILTGSWDNTARLWDLEGNEVQRFEGHTGHVYSVYFSRDGQRILTGSQDETAKLWDLEGNVLQDFEGHFEFVQDVCFSPDGESILTGSLDNTARLWLVTDAFLEEKVHHFGLQELYDRGTQLEPQDLKKVKQ